MPSKYENLRYALDGEAEVTPYKLRRKNAVGLKFTEAAEAAHYMHECVQNLAAEITATIPGAKINNHPTPGSFSAIFNSNADRHKFLQALNTRINELTTKQYKPQPNWPFK